MLHYFGLITYDNNVAAPLQIPKQVNTQYNVQIPNQQQVFGIFIPSHRPVFSYASVPNIPTQALTKQAAYDQYTNVIQNRYFGHNQQQASPTQLIKQALISFAVFGYDSEVIDGNDDARNAFEEFQAILKITLPPKIAFERLKVRPPEVILETKTGDFPIDSVSGGVASIIDMAWRIFMFSPEGKNFVCIIDEPENHLHPELQQTLLSDMMNAFPHVQFIVATHSPFMITSTNDSFVYVLDYNQENLVESRLLETVNKAGTANETLKDVLGLPYTMPLWAEKKFDTIVERYADVGVTDANMEQLGAELEAAGLGEYAPPHKGDQAPK